MRNIELASLVDLAVLGPNAGVTALRKGAELAQRYNVASLCVKPCDVNTAVDYVSQSPVMVSTVIGFPHGGTTTRAKVEELEEAMEFGCNEFDVVMNIGFFLSRKLQAVRSELRQICKTAYPHTVKVILETGYLNTDQISQACKMAEEAGALYVKTSTGFGPRGATEDDITTMQKACGLHVKASGGIRTREQAMHFAALGCKRLGFGYKSAITILETYRLGLSEREDW